VLACVRTCPTPEAAGDERLTCCLVLHVV